MRKRLTKAVIQKMLTKWVLVPAMQTAQAQTQSARSLASASASATSQVILNAGEEETQCVEEKEMVKDLDNQRKQTAAKKDLAVRIMTVRQRTRFAQSLDFVSVNATNLETPSAGVGGKKLAMEMKQPGRLKGTEEVKEKI